jgi:uracil-DNA glycosylase family 4
MAKKAVGKKGGGSNDSPSSASPSADAESGESIRREVDSEGVEQLKLVGDDLIETFTVLESEWHDCERCPLHAGRTNVVFARGTFPADILFVGEAPAKTEDEYGFPFLGRAGNILNSLIRHVHKANPDWTYGIINTVGCVPWDNTDDDEHHRVRAPDYDELKPCMPRFATLVHLCKPKGVILLGKVASIYWRNLFSANYPNLVIPRTLEIEHPAFIARKGGSRSIMYTNAQAAMKQFILGNAIKETRRH